MPSRFPTLASEVLNRGVFAFRSWAGQNGFEFPPAHEADLPRCRSAAEAYLLRAVYALGRWSPKVNAPIDEFAVDLAIETANGYRLAIEVDGMAFHQRTADQVAGDYYRQRRIVARGWTVIRFTAAECFRDPEKCARQIEVILIANAG